MKLKNLHIYENYGHDGYRIAAEFAGDHKVTLNLGEELGTKIVHLCLDDIVAAIQAASNVTAESLLRGPEDAAKEIEHQP